MGPGHEQIQTFDLLQSQQRFGCSPCKLYLGKQSQCNVSNIRHTEMMEMSTLSNRKKRSVLIKNWKAMSQLSDHIAASKALSQLVHELSEPFAAAHQWYYTLSTTLGQPLQCNKHDCYKLQECRTEMHKYVSQSWRTGATIVTTVDKIAIAECRNRSIRGAQEFPKLAKKNRCMRRSWLESRSTL